MNWNYKQPVEIRFGAGVIKTLAAEIKAFGGKRGLLVTSRSFVKRGLAGKIVDDSEGLIVTIYGEVSPNPEVSECDACSALIRENECDFVVALGGGSVMDCAKAAATFSVAGVASTEFLATGKAIPQEHLPIIAVPTTAGTGSEITSVSVLSDHQRGVKAPMASDGFYPKLAIVDPQLTHSVPLYITACTGFDVLCHAVESYWSIHHQPVCATLSVHAARLVMQHLLTAFNEPDNAEAREKMAEASVVAGLGFALPKTTSSHACSYPLTNLFGIPHGEACALTISHFMRFNAENGDPRTETLAKELGYADAHAFADAIDLLKSQTGMRADLKDLHLTDAQFDELVAASQHPNLLNNPVPVPVEFLQKMYGAMR